jgi:hypothetical protein
MINCFTGYVKKVSPDPYGEVVLIEINQELCCASIAITYLGSSGFAVGQPVRMTIEHSNPFETKEE